MEKEYALNIEDLKVVYKTQHSVVHAVNSLDLKLEKGKALGLVGRPVRARLQQDLRSSDWFRIRRELLKGAAFFSMAGMF